MGKLSQLLVMAVAVAMVTLTMVPVALAGTDDYPAPWRAPTPLDYTEDTWGYLNRECTSFVAWRLHSRNRFEMPRAIGGAGEWGAWAANHGYAVNMTPAVGSVAWWGGSKGYHVAWVESVSGGTVTIEDYNHYIDPDDHSKGTDGAYHEYSITTSTVSGYIHFKDISSGQGTGVGNATFLGGATLKNGQKMLRSQYLASPNGLYALILQSDGNLVLYGSGYRSQWSSKTAGRGGTYLRMQSDGNLVLYTSTGKAVWASGTDGNSGCKATVQNDGNFVLYDGIDRAKWSSKTGGHPSPSSAGSDRLRNGQTLAANKYLQSGDKRFHLLLRSDGNLVMYEPGYRVDWASNTAGSGATFLGMQSDGNLVLYTAARKAVWASRTDGGRTSYVVMQNDGNVVVYGGGGARWASNTAGHSADRTPPVTTAKGTDDSWHNRPVTVTLSATDGGGAGLSGGSARTEYKVDSGVWTTGTKIVVAAPSSHANDGTHTVSFRSIDAAVNTEVTKTVTVRIDTTAPSLTVSGVSSGAWLDSAASVGLRASDTGSGVMKVEYSLDGVAGSTSEAGVRLSIAATPNSGHTLTCSATDAAGNARARRTMKFTIDTVGPITTARAAAGLKRRAVSLRYKIQDALSPTAKAVHIVVKSASGQTVKKLSIGTISTGAWHSAKWIPRAKGTYRYYVHAKDAAGNAPRGMGSARVVVK